MYKKVVILKIKSKHLEVNFKGSGGIIITLALIVVVYLTA